MLLAIDAGNTTVSLGIFKDKRLVYAKRILTRKPASKGYYLKKIKQLPFQSSAVTDIIISSVVPDTTKVLKAVSKSNFRIKPVILGEDLIVPIKNLYKNPGQVGQDRLVNAYSGYKKFGGGLIIVDFGTAVTFDIVSKKGEYLGGLIFPGMETGLNALFEKAALLPRITLKKPGALIGKDTVTSMRSGVLNGYAALCKGLVAMIKREAGKDYKVILTGGHAGLIHRYCRCGIIQPNLTLEGLNLIYNYFSLDKKT